MRGNRLSLTFTLCLGLARFIYTASDVTWPSRTLVVSPACGVDGLFRPHWDTVCQRGEMKSPDTLSRSTKAGFSGKSIPIPLSGNSLPCLSSLYLNDWELIGSPEKSTPLSRNVQSARNNVSCAIVIFLTGVPTAQKRLSTVGHFAI